MKPKTDPWEEQVRLTLIRLALMQTRFRDKYLTETYDRDIIEVWREFLLRPTVSVSNKKSEFERLNDMLESL